MKDIYYKIVGEGYPVVLLHGNGEDHHIFDELVSYLSSNYKCILVDTRYHGLSSRSGQLSYLQFSQDVMDIMDELKIDEYDIIGFSDGGITSLLVSIHDYGLKHMIIIGANVKASGLKLMARLNNWLMMFCLLPFCIYNKDMRVKWRLTKLMEFMPEISAGDLEKIHIPTLILSGEYDLIKPEETKYIHKHLKYSVSKVIRNGYHSLLTENFSETYREIKLFLEACHKEEEQ